MTNEQSTIDNNQLPKGCKHTEVGVIPEDWEVKRLKQISPSQSVGLVINPSSYFDNEGSVPMLVGSQISENHINWELANRISSVSNELLPASRLTAGDLVTVRVGNPGVTAVVPPELDGCNCASMMIVRQYSSFSSLWLCYVMNSRIGRSQVEHVQYGTAQKQFNISDAIDFTYPVPPLPEQRSIAQALSDVDALITALDKAIAKKRAIKTATMQQLLTGKKRLPGFGEGKGDRQTEIGVIPEDWNLRNIGDIGSVSSGGTPSRTNPKYWNGSIPWVTTTQIDFNIINNAEQFITTDGLKYSAAKLFPPGTLLMAMYGQGKTRGKVAILDVEASTNQACAAITFGRDVCQSYVFHYLIFQYEAIRNLSNTGNQENLNGLIIKSIQILLANVEEQQAIATVLSDMDAEIAALETRLAKTQSIKQGMMQELLTGRTRLV
ncbi:restriction endonuclease subunit S [Leptolyngbya sp. FACHB-671]|uniref:restriction endonuclease subunit S n=1 Tax=Leptolyngbya sp. FACHB-671 TaxID=2692812 RepID=UPI001684B2DE|nr:restriction endonuclease subunit S [Leptolyngbya sp. FACHB-671]MBD2068906.1 restriction endonuclease subunit S [Leptolyngbya sp. FACHB-671]